MGSTLGEENGKSGTRYMPRFLTLTQGIWTGWGDVRPFQSPGCHAASIFAVKVLEDVVQSLTRSPKEAG